MNRSEPLFKWPEEGVTRAPFVVYNDEDIFKAEMKHIFRGRIWHYMGLEIEIPNPGDYRLMEVGETSVIVLRNANGGVNAMINRCAHKGTVLLYEPFGNVENHLMCVYHNWMYDLDGNLESVPFARGINGKGGLPDSFRKEDHGLDRLRIETLNGLIFATFVQDMEPLREYLGPNIVANTERVCFKEFKVLGYYSQYLDSNWKLYFENASDPYHATILHAWATKLKLNRLTMDGAIEMGHKGWHHLSWSKMATDKGGEVYDTENFRTGTEAFEKFGLHDPTLVKQWPEFEDGITTAIQTGFPNFVLQQIHNTLATRILVPRGVGGSELIWTVLGYADDTDEQTAMRLKQGNLIGPSGYISMEDGMIGGLIQRGFKGDLDKAAVMEMDGDSIETIRGSRASECGVRGFWTAYRELMGV